MSRIDERWESAQAAVEADVREAGPAGPLATATTMVEVLARRQAVRWAEERWQGLAPVRLLGPRREGAVAGSGTVVVEGQVDARWAARGGAGGTYEGLATTGGRYVLVTPTEPRVASGRLWLETRGLGAYRGGLLVVDGPEGAEVVEVADVEVTRVRGTSVAEVTLSQPLRVTPARLRVPTAQASLGSIVETVEWNGVDASRLVLDALHRSIRSDDPVVLEWIDIRFGGGLQRFVVTVRDVEEEDATRTTPPRTILTVDFVPGVDAASTRGFLVHYDLVPAGQVASLPKASLTSSELGAWVAVEGAVDAPAGLEGDVRRQTFLLEGADGRGALASGELRFDRASRAAEFRLTSGEEVPVLRAPVAVYDGLATLTEGESVGREVLGSGDARVAGQRFALSRGPLTYVSPKSLGAGAGEARSTLRVWVDGVAWEEVPSFYGVGPSARVFVVEHAADGEATVVMGDGVRGARVPSGVDNVVASYRFGAGEVAPPPGTVRAVKALPGLREVRSPLPFTPGRGVTEDAGLIEAARQQALMLDRAVSAADYGALAAREAGVRRAEAELAWLEDARTVGVRVVVIGALDEDLQGRGEPGTVVSVVAARPVRLRLAMTVLHDPRRRPEEVEAAVREALLGPEGALHVSRVPLGRALALSAVHAAALGARGVVGLRETRWRFGRSAAEVDATGTRCAGPGAYFALRASDLALELVAEDARRVLGVDANSYGARGARPAEVPVAPSFDGFERYFEEKLWALLPEVYRMPDADGVPPDATRAVVRTMAASAARMRRLVDRTWEDQGVETCDAAELPRFAALVGTRALSSLDARARRVDVATTIHARRRRGTLYAIEAAVRSLGDVDVAVVEAFRGLARAFHGLDDLPTETRGVWSGTPRGGTADLRRPLGAALVAGAFSDFAHTPDVRAPRGRDGWHALRTLRLHLFPLRAFEVRESDAAPLRDAGEPTYTFDPSGRDVPLFTRATLATRPARQVRRRGEAPEAFETWSPVAPWEVSAPLTCRLLGHVAYVLRDEHVLALAALPAGRAPSAAELAALRAIVGRRFDDEVRLATRLADLGVVGIGAAAEPPWYRELLALALLPRTGKAASWPAALALGREEAGALEVVARERVSGADLSARECHPRPRDGGVRALVDPARGRFAAAGGADGAALRVVRYHVGVPMPIGALPIARADVVADAAPSRGGGDVALPAGGQLTFGDSRSYRLMVDEAATREDLRVQAADGARPYVRLAGGAVVAAVGAARRLELSGVWLGDAPLVLGRAHDAAPGVVDWDEVVVRDATLDPGGTRADGDAIAPVSLVVRARVRRLVVERSVLGGLVVDREAGGSLGELWVRDSIVDGRFAGGVAIDAGDAAADLARTTLLGGLVVGRLEASDVVVFGEARVVDTANGCFRFSAADGGSRLPRRFESWPAAVGSDARVEAGFFRSLRFGDPEYAQMSALAPLELREGAETGGERGAYARLGEAARLRGVALKLEELTPVGVRAAFLPGGPLHGA